MDAHNTVTVEEGDRYPLRPPIIIASETWKSERFYKPFSARLAFLRGFDPLRWYQTCIPDVMAA
jgi:hypothetical protein